MGCPVHFSTSGGMGSALLSKPQTVDDILRTLVRNLPSPVSCKIRLLPTPEATLQLVQLIERCGVAAVAVHGRYVAQRPRDPAHWPQIAAVATAISSIPVIANGDVLTYADFQRLRDETGADAAMCARGAQWNASVFRRDGLLAAATVRRAYAEACARWDNPVGNSKYCLREMLIEDVGLEGREGRALGAVKNNAQLRAMYQLDAAGDAEDDARSLEGDAENGARAGKRTCLAAPTAPADPPPQQT